MCIVPWLHLNRWLYLQIFPKMWSHRHKPKTAVLWQHLLDLFHSQNILTFFNILADFISFPHNRLIIPHVVHISRDQVNNTIIHWSIPSPYNNIFDIWHPRISPSHAHLLQTIVKNHSLWNLSHKTIKYPQSLVGLFLWNAFAHISEHLKGM